MEGLTEAFPGDTRVRYGGGIVSVSVAVVERRAAGIDAPRGANGFGYDPVFYFPEFDAMMAQLDPEVKNRISHRGRAALAAVAVLEPLMAENAAQAMIVVIASPPR